MSISNQQRAQVRERAGNCCEYCRVAQAGRLAKFHIDHIVAAKHGGTDDDNNLCLACPKCNTCKGSNIAAVDPLTQEATRLYNPRLQQWSDHFSINPDVTLSGLTPDGRATITGMRMNDEERVKQRLGELILGEYPCQAD